MNNPPPCYSFRFSLSNLNTLLGIGLFFLQIGGLWALDFQAEGEKQLALNNPKKALTYLEAAVAQNSTSDQIYLDLGLTYQRLAMSEEAQSAFRKGAELAGENQKILYFNLGVACFQAKAWSAAEEAYTKALELDPTYAAAVLNRANARLEQQLWDASAADYQKYQLLEPDNPQKAKIDQVIQLLGQAQLEQQALQVAEKTKQAREAEAKKRQDEADAAAKAEADRLADIERQKQAEILAKIKDSLQGASQDSQSIDSAPPPVKSEDGDFALEP